MNHTVLLLAYQTQKDPFHLSALFLVQNYECGETNRDLLSRTFQTIVDNNSSKWESATVLFARGYFSFLCEFAATFILQMLSKIYNYIDTSNHLDILYCVEKVNETNSLF